MSAQAHLQKAEAESKEAQLEREKAVADSPRVALANSYIVPDAYLDRGDMNTPMASHLDRARYLERHARQHEQAASELEGFESAQCKQVPAAERATCPILGPITGATDVDRGIRLQFSDEQRASTMLSRMRCRYAYARARALTGQTTCPLDVPGVQVRTAPDPRAIDIIGPDANTTAEIRRLARAQLDEATMGGK